MRVVEGAQLRRWIVVCMLGLLASPAAAIEFRPSFVSPSPSRLELNGSGARQSLLPQNQIGGTDAAAPASNRHLKAIGLSLLLPGSAQLRAGNTSRGLAFLGAEGAIWAAFATFRIQGGLRRDSYLEMARLFAGVEHPDGRDDDYYRLLGLINSSDVYDIVVRSDARRLYEDDLEAREAYLAEHRIPADRAWEWESDAARVRYREKRNDSLSAYRVSRNMVGLAVVNRLASMFDAVLSQHGGAGETRLSLRPGPELGAARLTLTRKLR